MPRVKKTEKKTQPVSNKKMELNKCLRDYLKKDKKKIDKQQDRRMHFDKR